MATDIAGRIGNGVGAMDGGVPGPIRKPAAGLFDHAFPSLLRLAEKRRYGVDAVGACVRVEPLLGEGGERDSVASPKGIRDCEYELG